MVTKIYLKPTYLPTVTVLTVVRVVKNLFSNKTFFFTKKLFSPKIWYGTQKLKMWRKKTKKQLKKWQNSKCDNTKY